MHILNTTQIHFDFIEDSIKANTVEDIFQHVEAGLKNLDNKIRFRRIKKILRLGHEETSYTIGNGVAVLNAKTFGVNRKVIGFLRLSKPVDFKADDGKQCDLIAVILSPQNHGPLHLRRLSRVSRLLKDTKIVDKLREAEDVDVLKILLGSPDAADNSKEVAKAA
ncbi:MAG: hypothetical protein CL565_02670 [Alphaproteobacteria bacterium]|nr:hypothetical protein [Alphaproteobacteria bacterium]